MLRDRHIALLGQHIAVLARRIAVNVAQVQYIALVVIILALKIQAL